MITCFECGDNHLARDCTNRELVSGPAPWCGTCDERTRHIELADGRVARCAYCHPQRDRQLAQHRRCPNCRKTVVAWDSAPDCGHHILGGVPRPYAGRPASPPAPRSPASEAARQVAESRASRLLV